MGSQLVESYCLRGGCSGDAGVYVIQYGGILAAISPALEKRLDEGGNTERDNEVWTLVLRAIS